MSNVINFFEAVEKLRPANDDIPDEVVEEILESCLDMSRDILSILAEEGYDIHSEEYAHDIAFLVECIKGLAYKSVGISFPTQKLARILFEIPDEKQFIESFFE